MKGDIESDSGDGDTGVNAEHEAVLESDSGPGEDHRRKCRKGGLYTEVALCVTKVCVDIGGGPTSPGGAAS